MARSIFTTIFSLSIAIALPAAAQEEGGGVSPAAEVEQATGQHVEVLSDLLDKVPEDVRGRIEKAIEVSRRGGEKALEALSRADLAGVEVGELMDGSQLRGLEKAIKAIEQASERATGKLQSVIDRVPDDVSQVIADTMERIVETRDAVIARLGGLLERGVSVARPPERPARPDVERPDNARPARPDLPTQVVRPQVPRPARPETPPRPDGRP